MKNIFIVAPFFPPSALPPAQRVRLIVQHASTLGYYPTVFTVEHKFREDKPDPWMLELAGNNFKQVLVKSLDQKKTRKFKIGDLGLRMLPFLVSALRKYAKIQKPVFILYPVPPWYILTIAPLVKSITGVPYGIDFIDPWVHDLDPSETSSFKKKASQWIARRMERMACRNASVIYSVSEGINNDLVKRYPELKNKKFVAVPYGAEQNDFELLREQLPQQQHEKIIIRYIGAISLDYYPVLDGVMPALEETAKNIPVEIEFLGTSYASELFSQPKLDKWIAGNNMQSYTKENSLRVSYRKAVELTLQSDILILFGGMVPYYAASKLMGLLVSRKPFIAFLHEDSFPAKLLADLQFPYLVTYSQAEENLPVKKINILADAIKRAISERKEFTGVDLSHPLIQQNTAFGMTKTFLEPINKLLQ